MTLHISQISANDDFELESIIRAFAESGNEPLVDSDGLYTRTRTYGRSTKNIPEQVHSGRKRTKHNYCIRTEEGKIVGIAYFDPELADCDGKAPPQISLAYLHPECSLQQEAILVLEEKLKTYKGHNSSE